MSLTAYALSYELDSAQMVGVSPESQIIAKELRNTREHSDLLAYRQVLVHQGRAQIPSVTRLLADVELTLKGLQNAAMREQANLVVSYFRKAASAYRVDGVPPLSATMAHDGSLLIEWTFSDRRMGFNIEPNQDESGWYFVSSETAGGRCVSGSLSTLNAAQLMKWALSKET